MSKPSAKRDMQLAEDWQLVAATIEGRRIIADLMTWGNVYTQIEDNDPIALARAVGENNFAKRVAYLLGLSPQQFPTHSWDDTDILDRMMSASTSTRQ